MQSGSLLTLEKLSVTYLVLYCACTVNTCLVCVSLLSDITPCQSQIQISDLKLTSPVGDLLPLQKFLRDVGQQSLFDCQRPLVTTFDIMMRRNFSVQTSGLSAQVSTNLQSPFRNRKSAGVLVEVRGFEPLTPALQTRCSAN